MTKILRHFKGKLNLKANNDFQVAQRFMAYVFRVISWLSTYFIVDSQTKSEIRKLCEYLSGIAKDRGIPGFVAYLKATRQALFLYLSGESLVKRTSGVSLDNQGFPKSLSPFKEIIQQEGPYRQMTLRFLTTVLASTRALKKITRPDLEPIRSPRVVVPSDRSLPSPVTFWKELGFKQWFKESSPRTVHFRDYHFSTKSGPNGPALGSSIADLSLIFRNKRLFDSIKIVGGPKLAQRMDTLVQELEFLKSGHPQFPERKLRKLSIIPDKEHKVRVVAILDYWSQTALYPLHVYLYRILKRIPQDCTHNQGQFQSNMSNWKYFGSVDLTAATDRFPIDFITFVLGPILPKSYLEAWREIMVGLPFDFSFGKQKEQVSYGVGTPMGAYTSWASFAIAHHYVMFSACQRVGIKWKDAPYALLGDDILIGDQRLCEEYKSIILDLGLNFSPNKTFESTEFCEFAKRVFWRGKEITPFPISALIGEGKFYELVPTLFGETLKGWSFPQGIGEAIASYYQIVKGFNAKYCKEIWHKAAVVEELMFYMREPRSAIKVITSLYRWKGIDHPGRIKNSTAKAAIQGCLLDLFVASDPLYKTMDPCAEKRKDQPLGKLASDMVMYYTGNEEEAKAAWACEAMSCIPLLNVYGQISEMYIKLKKRASVMEEGSDIWPLFLKTVGLPLSDGVFVERQQNRLARGASSLASNLFTKYHSMVKLEEELMKPPDMEDPYAFLRDLPPEVLADIQRSNS